MGRVPLHRVPRRRRRGAGQPQREATHPVLPRAGGRLAGQPARPVRPRRRDRHRRARRASTSTPSPSASIRPSSRVALLARTTPASFVAFDLLALGDADLRAQPYAERRRRLEEALAQARATGPSHAGHRQVDVARDWFSRFEGAGLDGVVVKAADLTLPAGQAGHDQGQARAHGRLRRRGFPVAQGGRRGRLAAPRTVRRQRRAPPRRGGLRIQRRPPPGVRRHARAVPRRRHSAAIRGYSEGNRAAGCRGARAGGAGART